MRGTDGANTVTPTTPPTVTEIRDGFNANDFKATETVSSNMRGTDNANTVAPDNATVGTTLTDLTAYTGSALPKIRSILVDTTDLQENQGNFATATGFSTFDSATDEVKTDEASRQASKADVSALSTFNPATDTVANVTLVNTTTNLTNQSAGSGATEAQVQTIVDGLNDFDPATDTVANVTLVDTTTSNTDMRGTDNVNTTTPPTVVEIRGGFNADDFKATETISSNMRGTDGANTVEPTNQTLTVAQNAKLNSLDTDNLDEPVSTRATKADVDQALVDYNVDTKTNVKPSIPV